MHQLLTNKVRLQLIYSNISRKRRLLQRELTERATSPKDIEHGRIVEANQALAMVEERKLPRLDPISPLKGIQLEVSFFFFN